MEKTQVCRYGRRARREHEDLRNNLEPASLLLGFWALSPPTVGTQVSSRLAHTLRSELSSIPAGFRKCERVRHISTRYGPDMP